jgi:hypothetical protein
MKKRAVLTFTVLSVLAATVGSAQPNAVSVDGAFADWSDEYCKPDPGACDDFPNQQDTKGACIASNLAATTPSPANTVYLRFDFDDTGLNGGNTGDACWLVDSDQDGNANRALCMEVTGNPFNTLQSFLYDCNDSSASCGGAVLSGTQAQTCAFTSALAAGQQLECSAGDPGDTAVECSIPVANLGWASGNIVLLSGCTFGSPQPNSAEHDCATSDGPFVIDPAGGGNTPVGLLEVSVD